MLLAFGCSSAFSQDNVVKLNLFGLGFLSPNVSYERVLSDNTALTVGLSGTLGFKRTITGSATTSSGQTESRDADGRFTGFSITPGFRYYTAGDAPEGFYLEPFLRYFSYKISVEDYNYERDLPGAGSEIVLVDGDGTLKAFGGGLIIGRQWIVADNFAIDLNGGFGLASGNLEFSTEDEDLTAEEFADIKSEIENDLSDTSVGFLDDVVVTATDESATINLDKALLPIIRFGLSLGYYF